MAQVSSTPQGLRDALEQARAETRPCVIAAVTDPERYLERLDVWWDVAPAEVSNEQAVQGYRAEYERARAANQRLFY